MVTMKACWGVRVLCVVVVCWMLVASGAHAEEEEEEEEGFEEFEFDLPDLEEMEGGEWDCSGVVNSVTLLCLLGGAKDLIGQIMQYVIDISWHLVLQDCTAPCLSALGL